MNVSFQPSNENGTFKWFVFDEATGKTLAKDLQTKSHAIIELHRIRIENDR